MDNLSDKDIAAVIKLAKDFGFKGFMGDCGQAALAINNILFKNEGNILGAFNKKFFEQGHPFGHIAVEFKGKFWDTDGYSKKIEEIESWGMLDEKDSYYKELADNYGFEFSEEAAFETIIHKFNSENDVHKYFRTFNLEKFSNFLEKALMQIESKKKNQHENNALNKNNFEYENFELK